MPDRNEPLEPKDPPLADEYELHQDPPPTHADALDQMGRRLSGTVTRPEQPSNVAPEELD
jgi:hypothetical protein